MVRRIWAHFDGKVIVPDEPLDLPVDLPLQVQLIGPEESQEASADQIADRLQRLARLAGSVSAPAPSSDALRRENLYDERV